MVQAMKRWILAWFAVGSLVMAAEKPPAANEAADKLPTVVGAIPGPVKALGPPIDMQSPGGIQMAVTASTEKAQAQVLQGLNHLHGGWEFEASRHFAIAMTEDPECLLAHWGMAMALLSPSPETDGARVAATERMLYLINEGKGSELERGYAFGLVKYIQEASTAAANAFRKVSEKFPNDMQSVIFVSLFGRSGYNEFGPLPDQQVAEDRLLDLIKKHPDSPVPLHALLLIRAEAPNLTSSLDLARKLTQLSPGYAPYFHVLGHYEWRCGEHGKAASAFGRAATIFDRWREENKASLADCPEWVKSECYRIVALSSKGDFETAYAASRRVAEVPLPAKRNGSAGTRMLLWEAKTLPARLLMKRGLPGNTNEAFHSLPTPDSLKPTLERSLAAWWIDGLRLALEAKRLAEAGKLQDAKVTAAVLSKHGESMSLLQEAAGKGGERSAWNRAFRALESIASEINGRIALAGPPVAHGSAYNWFRSAADRQQPATMLYPPPILQPMVGRVGEYYMLAKRPVDAVDAFKEALALYPNDIDTLKSLAGAYKAANLTKEAEETRALISKLEGQ